MKVYLSASWKKRELVRYLADLLRVERHEVYDFTDSSCRQSVEIPPERFPEQFDPALHVYADYLDRPEWRAAVEENRNALRWCDAVVLLLPCGIDATADWAYAVGLGKRSIVMGSPRAGERSPVHLWADRIVRTSDEVCVQLASWQAQGVLDVDNREEAEAAYWRRRTRERQRDMLGYAS